MNSQSFVGGILLTLIFVVFAGPCAFAADGDAEAKPPLNPQKLSWVAHIMRQQKGQQIDDIFFESTILPVYLVPSGEDLRPLVEVMFQSKNPKLEFTTFNSKKIKKQKLSDKYSVYAFLNSQVSELMIVAKDPAAGTEKREIVYLFAPEVQEFQIVSPWSALSASAGLSFLTYDQQRFGVLRMQSAIVSLQYLSTETANRWGWAAGLDLTVATYDSKPIDVNPQMIQGEILSSYRLSISEQSRWRHTVLFGLNHLSLESNGSQFGFSSLVSPSIGWKSKNYLTTTSSLSYEARLNTYDNFSLFSRRGLQMSATWSTVLKSSRRRDISVSYTSSQFESFNRQVSFDLLAFRLGFSI